MFWRMCSWFKHSTLIPILNKSCPSMASWVSCLRGPHGSMPTCPCLYGPCHGSARVCTAYTVPTQPSTHGLVDAQAWPHGCPACAVHTGMYGHTDAHTAPNGSTRLHTAIQMSTWFCTGMYGLHGHLHAYTAPHAHTGMHRSCLTGVLPARCPHDLNGA